MIIKLPSTLWLGNRDGNVSVAQRPLFPELD